MKIEQMATKIVSAPSMKKSHLPVRRVSIGRGKGRDGASAPPCGVPELALHAVEDARGDQGAEGVADEAAAGEYGGAHAEFLALVPFGQEEEGTGEERGLDEAEEESRQQRAHKAGSAVVSDVICARVDRAYFLVTPVRHDIIPQTIMQQGR